MAVSVTRITGKGTFKGLNSNLGAYRVTEDATPRIPGDSSGGVGSISADMIADKGTILFSGNIVELNDTSISPIRGIVRDISISNGEATITADTLMAKLTVSRTATAFHGTLVEAITYYLGLAGITSGFSVATAIRNRYVVYPGFYNNIWTFLKQMASVEKFEIASVNDIIVFREMHQFTAQANAGKQELSISTSNVALTAGVYCYNTAWVESEKVWPLNLNESPFQVGSGETIVHVLKSDVSLESILPAQVTTDSDLADYLSVVTNYNEFHKNNPNFIPMKPDHSYYMIHDGDHVINPFEWAGLGGYMNLEIDPEDSTQIIMTLRGAVNPTVGTWHIASAVFDGEDSFTFNNGLHVYGTGVRTRKELITVQTGADPAYVLEDSAPTIDNICIATKSQAYTAAAQVAASVAGPAMDYSSTAGRIKVAGSDGVYANPKFGEIAGTRIQYGDTIFRISTVSATALGLDYSAERDTMIEDFNKVWAGASFDNFNNEWAGKTFDEFSVEPLRRN
jgi:hypothetical protein